MRVLGRRAVRGGGLSHQPDFHCSLLGSRDGNDPHQSFNPEPNMTQSSNIIPFPIRKVSDDEIRARGIELMQAVDADLRRKGSSPAKRPADLGRSDRIFGYIAHHRAAAASGSLSDFDFYMRCLIIGGATTRKGYIELTKYLAEQIQAPYGEGIALSDKIDGKPWILVFLNTLAKQLRRMGPEFPTDKKGRRTSFKKGRRTEDA